MDQRILQRAFAAYLKIDGTAAEQPIEHRSGELICEGLRYVVLRNARRVLAVYRVKNNGALRRMKRWPLELGQPQHPKRGPSVVGEADRIELGAA